MNKTLSPVRTALTAAVTMLASASLFANEAPSSERVVSAGSAVTELLIALDAKDSLVAVDVTSQLPKEMELPKVGYHRRLSAEGLLALSPTKVIGSDEMGPSTTLEQLKSAGVDVEVVNTEANVEGLVDRIDQIANIMHRETQATALKQKLKRK